MKTEYDAIITNMAKLLEVQQKRELVAVDMIAAAIAAEREACAKVCEGYAPVMPKSSAQFFADVIRARGQK